MVGGVEAGDIGDNTGMLVILEALFPEDSLLRFMIRDTPATAEITGLTMSV